MGKREAWLAERQRGIGASEAAAVLGLSPWLTPLELYLRKTGQIPEKEATARMRFGLVWEKFIAELYRERFPAFELARWELRSIACEGAPWMLATPDAERDDGRLVEIKKVNHFAARDFGEDGSADVPIAYALQVQQQMACLGRTEADLAALIGDDDFRVYHLTLNVEIVERLKVAERDFMERVATANPPLPDFQHPTTADILRMIEPEAGKVIVLDDVAATVEMGAYLQYRDVEKAAKRAKEIAQSRLTHAMGDAELAYCGGYIITRKEVQRAGYSVKPTSYFSFSVKEPKHKETLNVESKSATFRGQHRIDDQG